MPNFQLVGALGLPILLAVAGQAGADPNPNEDAHDLSICRHINQSGPAGAITDALADARLAGATGVLQSSNHPGDVACCVELRRTGNVTLFPASLNGGQYNNVTVDADLTTLLNEGCGNVKVLTSLFGVCGAAGPVNGCARLRGTSLVMDGDTVGDIVGFEDPIWAHEFGHNQNLLHVSDATRVMNPTIFPTSTAVTQAECDSFHGSGFAGHSPPDQVLGPCDTCPAAPPVPSLSGRGVAALVLLLTTTALLAFARPRSMRARRS